MFTCIMSRYVSCEWSVVGEGWLIKTSQDYRMLAKISKSVKGSLGNLMSDQYESSNHIGNMREHCESVVSESTGYSVGRRKEKRMSKRCSQIFSSDVGEDTKSDVSSKPTFNLRSVSMVRFVLYLS